MKSTLKVDIEKKNYNTVDCAVVGVFAGIFIQVKVRLAFEFTCETK